MERIPIKYTPLAFMPIECIKENGEYVTYDNIRVRCTEIGFYDNTEHHCDGYVDSICRRIYDMSFSVVRDAWIRRMGKLSEKWIQVKMEKL